MCHLIPASSRIIMHLDAIGSLAKQTSVMICHAYSSITWYNLAMLVPPHLVWEASLAPLKVNSDLGLSPAPTSDIFGQHNSEQFRSINFTLLRESFLLTSLAISSEFRCVHVRSMCISRIQKPNLELQEDFLPRGQLPHPRCGLLRRELTWSAKHGKAEQPHWPAKYCWKLLGDNSAKLKTGEAQCTSFKRS